MADLETLKVKSGDGDYAIINKSDFDPSVHEPFDADAAKQVKGFTANDRQVFADLEAKRQYDANRGVPSGGSPIDSTRNPSGTFSEPTPTDVRYPNKDATEFENNHGAFTGRSAAEIRADEGMEDKPGGLIPEVHEAVQEATEAAANAADVATEAEAAARDPLDHDGDGKKGGAVDLDAMTVPELKAHAKAHEIDLGGATTKADIRAAIDAAG